MKKRLLVVAIVITLLGTGTAWMATNTTLSTDITTGSALTSGEIADVTALSSYFTVSQGAAELIEGVALYRIELGSANFSNTISINLMILNPQDMGGVLNNPNAYIDVKVYYADTNGTTTINDEGTFVKVSPDTGDHASYRMSRTEGDVFIKPSVTGKITLYVLASICTPGGIPPGQQSQLSNLRFYCHIAML